MPDNLHLILMNEGDYGHSVASPQVPGFVYGRPGQQLDRKDLREALRFAGAPDLPWIVHLAKRRVSPDGIPYTVRVMNETPAGERFKIAWRLDQFLETADGRDLLEHSPTTIGDVQLVCVLPDDTVGWILDQVDDRPDSLVMIMPVDEVMFQTLPISSEDQPGWGPVGLPRDATIRDLMDSVGSTENAGVGVLVGA